MRRHTHPISYDSLMKCRPQPAWPAKPAEPEVKVSDHAIVRYLERVLDVDIDAVKAEILAVAGNAAALGANAFRHGGNWYVIDNGTIVTIVPSDRRRFTRR